MGVRHVSWTGFLPYAVHRICVRVAISSTNTKEFSMKKKFPVANMFVQKLTANNERCKVARLPCFREQYFVRWKSGFVPYSSCLRIVYSGLQNFLKCFLKRYEIILEIFWNFLFLKFFKIIFKFPVIFLLQLQSTSLHLLPTAFRYSVTCLHPSSGNNDGVWALMEAWVRGWVRFLENL